MSKVDLHIHSTASDGRLSPEAVVRKSAELWMKLIALADHDSVDSFTPARAAAREFPGLVVIPATEISTDAPDGEIHILGYFMDYTDTGLETSLARLRNSREVRAQSMISRLANLDVHIDWKRVQEIAGRGAIGRPHLAQAMMEKGYISSIKEAFPKYIGRDGPAYVKREKITPPEAVTLILKTGGIPVLAHPFTTSEPEAIISELIPAGLAGIEAYYSSHTDEETERLANLADRYGLITTVGSDYHGLDSAAEKMIGDIEAPAAVTERLMELARQKLA
ncbi:PHP domain-containing protein [Chloroflexota bacterium]